MNSSGRRSPVRDFNIYSNFIAFILKENADSIVSSLNNLSERTEQLLSEGFKLTKDMKGKKIKDMRTIDDIFDKIVKKVQLKKAQIKKAYNDAFNMELNQVNVE
jgi:hypothetical protein